MSPVSFCSHLLVLWKQTQKRLKIFSGSGSINGDRENVMLQALSPDVLAATEEK